MSDEEARIGRAARGAGNAGETTKGFEDRWARKGARDRGEVPEKGDLSVKHGFEAQGGRRGQ